MATDTAFETGRLYSPIKRIADILTAGQSDPFVRLPALLGYWPMSATRLSGEAANHSSEYKPLSMTGTVLQGFDGNAYRQTGNGANYLYASSYGVMTGVESWIDPTIRGWTIGGWFKMIALPTVSSGLISKDAPAPNRGYNLHVLSTGIVRCGASGTGANVVVAASAPQPTGEWLYIVGRYVPGTSVDLFVGKTKTSNTTAVPAVQFVSTQNFEVGRFLAVDANTFYGNIRDAFICQSALPDSLVFALYDASVP